MAICRRIFDNRISCHFSSLVVSESTVFEILALNPDECFIIILLKRIWVLNVGWLVYINFIDGLIKVN